MVRTCHRWRYLVSPWKVYIEMDDILLVHRQKLWSISVTSHKTSTEVMDIQSFNCQSYRFISTSTGISLIQSNLGWSFKTTAVVTLITFPENRRKRELSALKTVTQYLHRFNVSVYKERYDWIRHSNASSTSCCGLTLSVTELLVFIPGCGRGCLLNKLCSYTTSKPPYM